MAPGGVARDARARALAFADVAAILALLAVVTLASGLPPAARYPLAAVLLFWAPGYLALEVRWPWRSVPVDDALELHGLAVGLSLVVVPILSVPLFFGGVLSAGTLLGAFTAVLVVLLVLATARRLRTRSWPAGRARGATPPRRARTSVGERVAAVAFGAAVVFAAVSVHASVTSGNEPRAPEAWLTDAEGALVPFPLHARTNATFEVHVHVRVHDEPVRFDVVHVVEAASGEEARRTAALNVTPGEDAVLPLSVDAPATPGDAWLRVRLDPAHGGDNLTLAAFMKVHQTGGDA